MHFLTAGILLADIKSKIWKMIKISKMIRVI